MERIEAEWVNLITDVYNGETISKHQYQEMRRSYFAGFTCAYKIFVDEMVEYDEEKREKMVNELWKEVKGFDNELRMRSN